MPKSLVAEQPLYYLGWIVQGTMKGFYAYPRFDLCKSKSWFFVTLAAAYYFIDKAVEEG